METVEKKPERLLRAIDWGDEAAVREILETGGVDLNGPREDGWTLLNKASARGYLSIVELLLAAGADPNAANEQELTPLHWAAFNGHVQILEFLVKAGADPFVATKNTGETPLHYACNFARCNAVRALLALGADLHAEDNEGRKPLHFCIRLNRYHFVEIKKALETLQILVSFGAPWDSKCDELVSSGEARKEAPALRLCMSQWAQDVADGLSFTCIPFEVIARGADSTQVYIDDLKSSMNQ